jgi:hypothetical protein
MIDSPCAFRSGTLCKTAAGHSSYRTAFRVPGQAVHGSILASRPVPALLIILVPITSYLANHHA